MTTTTDWNPLLRGEFDKPYWRELQEFVRDESLLVLSKPIGRQAFAQALRERHARTAG